MTAPVTKQSQIFRMEEMKKVLCAGPHISNTHSCGNSIAADLSKRFYLNATGKRGQDIGRQVHGQRKKSNCDQDDTFYENGHLSPVQHLFDSGTDPFCQYNAKGKGKNREEVLHGHRKIPFG